MIYESNSLPGLAVVVVEVVVVVGVVVVAAAVVVLQSFSVEQVDVWILSPSQGGPPLSGHRQERWRVPVPSPQVRVQADHSLHSLQALLKTGEEEIKWCDMENISGPKSTYFQRCE